jgi:hypothetical protein
MHVECGNLQMNPKFLLKLFHGFVKTGALIVRDTNKINVHSVDMISRFIINNIRLMLERI